MTDWTTLSDTDLAQDKPLTQSKSRALRDNPIAITEAASGAPRIAPAALNFPYVQAKRTTNQTAIGTTVTKVQLNAEDLDPDSLFDTTTYKFTPNKAGLYRVSLFLQGTSGSNTNNEITGYIYKNGAAVSSNSGAAVASGTKTFVSTEALVQMNGTTDYIEAYVSFANEVSAGAVLNGARFIALAVCES